MNSHVTCPYCAKKYKCYIRTSHLALHGKTKEQTLLEFPGQLFETDAWVATKKEIANKARLRLSDPVNRKIISDATLIAMQRSDVKENHLIAVRKPKSEATRKLMSDKATVRMARPECRAKLFTPETAAKISKAKFEYWKNNPDQKQRVSEIWKTVRDRDPVAWKTHLQNISHSGFEAAWGKSETAFETRMYAILTADGLKFEKQWPIDGKRFDAYLPEQKILIEFDGNFWHPMSIDECKYEWQISNYHNDIEKNEIAKTTGLRLIRIRETDEIVSIKPLLDDCHS
jgi:very-short-patch-repair endonuclease